MLGDRSILGLVLALESEARSLLGDQNWTFMSGRMVRQDLSADGTQLLCVCSGVGFTNARRAAQWLIDKGVCALAGAGVAGGLDPDLKAGELVIADVILEEHRHENSGIWRADARYAELARTFLAGQELPVHQGPVITCRRAALSVESKKRLYLSSKALAVDMESTGIAVAAGKARLPFFVMRAVCDPASRPVSQEIYACLAPTGKVRMRALLLALIRQPGLIMDVLRIRRDYVAAKNSLARAWHLQFDNGLFRLLTSRKTDNRDRIGE